MKAKLSPCNGTIDKGYLFECPGCGEWHRVRVEGPNPCWTFNGDIYKPTFGPSLLVRGKKYDPDTKKTTPYVCHSFVKNGHVQFLNDCTHEKAGQTVPMLDWED